MLVSLIRQSSIYREDPSNYPNLETTIAAVNDTVKAQQLNAALALIDAIGPGQIEVKGDEDATHFSQDAEREALVSYCLTVCFDAPANSISSFTRRTSSTIPSPVKLLG
jgi:hypothetical protein